MTQMILAAQAAQGGGSSMTSFIIMMVAIFAIMYFFMIKPQQKRQKEIQNFQNSLRKVLLSLQAVASMVPSRRLTLPQVSSR